MPQSETHRDWRERRRSIRWDDESPLRVSLSTPKGDLEVRHGRFEGGRSDGVEVVQVDTGAAKVLILPSRGMSIWEIHCGGVRFGWNSPVAGPVHPALVPVHDPSGLGWLEGFDELLVRCGLESNGAPQFDASGQLVHPLHGRIGNLPADSLAVEYDEAAGRIELVGEVRESKLFFKDLRLRTRLRFHAGSADVEILDDVTNGLSHDATIQMLYHINLGVPVLGEGSVLKAPIEELAPKDSLSAGEIDHWNEYPEPTRGYTERVYFARLASDEFHDTAVMLEGAEGDKAMGVSFHTQSLPRFVVWKNTADLADGYVTGLEPSTNYPNTKEYEESQGRVVTIPGEETVSFRMKLHPMIDREAIAKMNERIESLRDNVSPEIHTDPRPGWSPGA